MAGEKNQYLIYLIIEQLYTLLLSYLLVFLFLFFSFQPSYFGQNLK